MDQQAIRIAAVKAADAINAIEGASVSDYARDLSFRWAKGEITGEEIQASLLRYYQNMAAEVRECRAVSVPEGHFCLVAEFYRCEEIN